MLYSVVKLYGKERFMKSIIRWLVPLSLLLFLTACTPKYKTVYTYVKPHDPKTVTCIQKCKANLDTCRKVCKANFDLCAQKAKVHAKQIYEKKLQNYYKALEQYTRDLERYHLESELFWYDDYYYYRNGIGFYGPFAPAIIIRPRPYYTSQRPVKPSLEQEILRTQLKECRIDCHCLQSYDDCYQACGGKIIEKKVCVQNCPK